MTNPEQNKWGQTILNGDEAQPIKKEDRNYKYKELLSNSKSKRPRTNTLFLILKTNPTPNTKAKTDNIET